MAETVVCDEVAVTEAAALVLHNLTEFGHDPADLYSVRCYAAHAAQGNKVWRESSDYGLRVNPEGFSWELSLGGDYRVVIVLLPTYDFGCNAWNGPASVILRGGATGDTAAELLTKLAAILKRNPR